jgi:signal-transduction protein with cAMP-binding, CBS, and nucleotidyltransferase domain
MLVEDVATAPAVLCKMDATIARVAREMREQDVGSVVVVDDHNRLCGVVTDRDLVVRALASGRPAEAKVADVMTHDVVALHGDADLLAATRQMASWACRRVPVVDADGTVRGMLTADDLALVLSELIDNLSRAVRTEVRPGRKGVLPRLPTPPDHVGHGTEA